MKKTIFNRRDFLSLTASALAGMGALGPVTVLARQPQKLDILMLGGIDFLQSLSDQVNVGLSCLP